MAELVDDWFSMDDFMSSAADGSLRSAFQPMVGGEQKVVGLEVLIRWIHPRHGLLNAAQFIDHIDSHAAFYEIARISIDSVMELIEDGISGLIFGINISEFDLANPRVIELFCRSRPAFDASSCDVLLEISESIDFSRNKHLMDSVRQLEQAGYHFAIDDFFSDESTTFPIRKINLKAMKLDMHISRSYRSSHNDLVLIKTMVYYCNLMNIVLVAEGVEERDQFVELRAIGVHKFQGYLFSKAVFREDLWSILETLGYDPAHEPFTVKRFWKDVYRIGT